MKWFPSFGFQRRKRELQEEIDAHLQMAIADYTITKLGKEQLASDYERWGRMVATIEGIMTAKRGNA
jgi:hypothetical protein